MSTAVHAQEGHDRSDLPLVVRSSVKLGLVQSLVVLAASLSYRFLGGTAESAAVGLLVLGGLAATAILPGLWTRARHAEGIAGAAGIGLGATIVYLVVDVALLQPIGTYSNRWLAIGGGSNWWYHPVWWMAGTFIAWMGATALANQAAKRGNPSPGVLLVSALTAAGLFGVLAVLVGVPGAGWSLGTFGVAFLPGLALAAFVSWLGSRSS